MSRLLRIVMFQFHPFLRLMPLFIIFFFCSFQISERCTSFSDFKKAHSIFRFQISTVFAADRYTIPKEITILINQGKKDEAKRALEEYRKNDPGNPLAIFYLAQVTDDPRMAQALYKETELLADRSLAAEAAYARAELHFYNGDLSAAAEVYEKIAAQYPSAPRYADSLYRLGMTCLASGKVEKALSAYRNCQNAEKSSERKTLAEAGIMECYAAHKDWNHALESARKVLEGRDDGNALTPRVLEVTALAWRELGNEENAVKFTQRLAANFPGSYQTHTLRENGTLDDTGQNNVTDRKIIKDSIRPVTETAQKKQTAETGQSEAEYSSGTEAGSDESGSKFSIQAAAFEDRFNALKLYRRLKDSGFPSRVEMKTVGSKHFYLVQVGSFNSRKEAEEMSLQVSKITNAKANVIVVK
ncbi:MAG: tetratricopeptide repeat protein [Candidatus Latescibacterota bacterium]